MKNTFPYIKYFVPSEFDSPDEPGSGHGMNYELVYMLNYIRIKIERPIIINSGVRTPKHNIDVGGKTNSAHLDGNAADIHCHGDIFRYWFILYAQKIGFRRIFIYETHIHVDIDPLKPQPVLGYMKPKK